MGCSLIISYDDLTFGHTGGGPYGPSGVFYPTGGKCTAWCTCGPTSPFGGTPLGNPASGMTGSVVIPIECKPGEDCCEQGKECGNPNLGDLTEWDITDSIWLDEHGNPTNWGSGFNNTLQNIFKDKNINPEFAACIMQCDPAGGKDFVAYCRQKCWEKTHEGAAPSDDELQEEADKVNDAFNDAFGKFYKFGQDFLRNGGNVTNGDGAASEPICVCCPDCCGRDHRHNFEEAGHPSVGRDSSVGGGDSGKTLEDLAREGIGFPPTSFRHPEERAALPDVDYFNSTDTYFYKKGNEPLATLLERDKLLQEELDTLYSKFKLTEDSRKVLTKFRPFIYPANPTVLTVDPGTAIIKTVTEEDEHVKFSGGQVSFSDDTQTNNTLRVDEVCIAFTSRGSYALGAREECLDKCWDDLHKNRGGQLKVVRGVGEADENTREIKASYSSDYRNYVPIAYVIIPRNYRQGDVLSEGNVKDIRSMFTTSELSLTERRALRNAYKPSKTNPLLTRKDPRFTDLQRSQTAELPINVFDLDQNQQSSDKVLTPGHHEGRLLGLEQAINKEAWMGVKREHEDVEIPEVDGSWSVPLNLTGENQEIAALRPAYRRFMSEDYDIRTSTGAAKKSYEAEKILVKRQLVRFDNLTYDGFDRRTSHIKQKETRIGNILSKDVYQRSKLLIAQIEINFNDGKLADYNWKTIKSQTDSLDKSWFSRFGKAFKKEKFDFSQDNHYLPRVTSVPYEGDYDLYNSDFGFSIGKIHPYYLDLEAIGFQRGSMDSVMMIPQMVWHSNSNDMPGFAVKEIYRFESIGRRLDSRKGRINRTVQESLGFQELRNVNGVLAEADYGYSGVCLGVKRLHKKEDADKQPAVYRLTLIGPANHTLNGTSVPSKEWAR